MYAAKAHILSDQSAHCQACIANHIAAAAGNGYTYKAWIYALVGYLEAFNLPLPASTNDTAAAVAAGNVATEDVIYMLEGFGIEHGVDMTKLLSISEYICNALGRQGNSRAARALLAKRDEE